MHNGTPAEEFATHLFLSVGWAGSSRLQSLMPGIATQPNDLDIGMRIEFPHFGGSQMREAGDNPKIKFSDGTSYAKTHCLVHKGRVFYYYLDEHCLVDAHAVRDFPTRASSVNMLYRIPAGHVRDPLVVFGAISTIAREFGEGLPLSQPLEALMGRRLKAVDGSYAPTLPPPESREVDLTYVFPERIVSAIRELVTRLADFAPSILSREAMVYAPAVQWVMPRLKLDRHFAVLARREPGASGMPRVRRQGCFRRRFRASLLRGTR